MFKKSLLILLSCGLLTLAGIIAYALLGGHTPEETMREAQARMAAGKYNEVINLLNSVEHGHSIKNNRALKVQLWQLRKEAQSRLDNPAGALKDVQLLLANGRDKDPELLLDQIRYLARNKQGDEARTEAKRFLEAYPEHSRGLELAGEACQTAYQPLLRELFDTIDRELSSTKRELARAILLTYLYRPYGDPMVQHAADRMEELFGQEQQLIVKWPTIWSKAQVLRERIQEALGFFQQSLDLGGEPVAAFHAVTIALEQSGRIDDLLFACEIQRRMFAHGYVLESGVLASWVRIQHQSPQAAIATIERWLPDARIPELAKLGERPTTAEQLALVRALAAWQMRDPNAVQAAATMVHTLREAGWSANLPLQLSLATRRLINNNQDTAQIEASLRRVIDATIRTPPPLRRPDFVAEFAPILIDSLIVRNASEAEVLAALSTWRTGRPDAVEPLLRTAEYQMSLGNTTAALVAVQEAAAIAPDHPELFSLHLSIARRKSDGTPQDGVNLLNQCISGRKLLPDARDPIGYVLCAEAALRLNDRALASIALACARSAIGSFPRANIPRQLELRALLLQQDYDEAARTAALTIPAVTPDATTLSLAIEATKLAGQPIRHLLGMAMPRVPQNPQLQVELLQLALADAPNHADRFVSAAMTGTDVALTSRILIVRAFTAAGRLDEAQQQLSACGASTTPEEHAQLAEAFCQWLLARAERESDATLLALLNSHLHRLGLDTGSQQAMLAIALKLKNRHPKTAFAILNTSLPAALPSERTGELYIAFGDLALTQTDCVRAEAAWTAALGFTDGQQIAERLSRLLLLLGKEQTALKVYALVNQPTDGALAARFGKTGLAVLLLADALQRNPTDLIVHAALQTFGQPTMVDWLPATDEREQKLRLELLSGLTDPLLGRLCLPRAEQELARNAKVKTHSLLLARALADSDQAQAAGFLHAELLRAGYRSPILWREVAYAGQHADYVTSPELLQQVMSATTAGLTTDSPLTTAFALQQIVRAFEQAGMTDLAKTTLLQQWQTTPKARPCTAADLALIAAGHVPANVCLILEQVLLGPHECDRRAVLQQYYRSATTLVADAPHTKQRFCDIALGHIASDGAHGEIVHFLLANAKEQDAVLAKQLLIDHLTMICTGKNEPELLDNSIESLCKLIGVAACSLEVEKLLMRYPTTLPLWSARVRLRSRLDDDPAPLQELRMVLSHAIDPAADLTFLGLAAAGRQLTSKDYTRFASLPEALRQSPAGEYVAAMLALRLGHAEEAIQRFAKAMPQPDGRHLYELALAHLESSAPDGTEQAIAALQLLRANYPSSSLARHAGSFVRQLSPRAVKASDNDEKR